MDINLLFRAGLRSCGRVLRILPTKDIGSPMEYMMGVLEEKTLPSLNIVYPYIFPADVILAKLIPVDGVPKEVQLAEGPMLSSDYTYYRVPLNMTEGLEIMSIKSCNPARSTSVSNVGYGNSSFGVANCLHNAGSSRSWGRYSSANLYEAAAYAQLNYADRQLAGQFTEPFRFKFYSPNILAIVTEWAYPGLSLKIEFNLENDKNLVSIPKTAYEGIRKLFILDLKSSLYEEYGLFETVETQIGNINLKIDEWSSAANERDDLYEKYESTAHFRTSSMRTG